MFRECGPGGNRHPKILLDEHRKLDQRNLPRWKRALPRIHCSYWPWQFWITRVISPVLSQLFLFFAVWWSSFPSFLLRVPVEVSFDVEMLLPLTTSIVLPMTSDASSASPDAHTRAVCSVCPEAFHVHNKSPQQHVSSLPTLLVLGCHFALLTSQASYSKSLSIYFVFIDFVSFLLPHKAFWSSIL